MTKFEVRLADGEAYDEDWESVEANGPRSAAEAFVEGYEVSRHRYPVASGDETLRVEVWTPTGAVVRYIVEGEIVRNYSVQVVEVKK